MKESNHPLHERRNFKISEFSRIYGICRTLVYREIKMGRLRSFKFGRSTLISREAAEQWQKDIEFFPNKSQAL